MPRLFNEAAQTTGRSFTGAPGAFGPAMARPGRHAGSSLADAVRCGPRATLRRAAALALALALAPTLASAQSLEAVTAKLAAPGGADQMMGALAACLADGGTTDPTMQRFADAGWTADYDTEMGMIYLAPPEGDVYVTLADDGRFCDVASEAIRLGDAAGMMIRFAAEASVATIPSVSAEGCMVFDIAGATVTLTSTGQDPVCNASDTSALRAVWGP